MPRTAVTIYEYEEATGRILIARTGMEGDVYAPMHGGVMLTVTGEQDNRPKYVYIKRGRPTPRPKVGLPEEIYLAVGEERELPYRFPPNCKITIDSAEHVVTGRKLVLEGTEISTFTVRITHFPYQDERMEVIVE